MALSACYSTGDGSGPPTSSLYFPVGATTSLHGNVLYAVSSDFDLQYNGGTLQAYDLHLIRRHVALAIKDVRDPELLPFYTRNPPPAGSCPAFIPEYKDDGSGDRQPLGQTCAPPVDSARYIRSSVVLGAFATEIQRSQCELAPRTVAEKFAEEVPCPQAGTRLFVPMRSDASVTWADVALDDPNIAPPADGASYAPFHPSCGAETNGNRCDAAHSAGNRASEAGNTRLQTMPGEPFGLAQSQLGESLVVTHQSDTKVSLLRSGLELDGRVDTPALQYVFDGVPVGGVGIASVPHDRAVACTPDGPCVVAPPQPAYLVSSRAAPELSLLRYYSDEAKDASGNVVSSALRRPFLLKERVFPVVANASGFDSRGIAFDRTRRLACKAKVRASVAATDSTFASRMEECGRLPARAFIVNRSPASLLAGEMGGPGTLDGSYDADVLRITSTIPLSFGPARVYLAPIVDSDGNAVLRVFVVCSDSSQVFIFDPETLRLENVIKTAIGPAAIAFDPFVMEDVAQRKPVPLDPRQDAALGIRRYRFAYLVSFTNSIIQVIDLDNSRADKSTFEKIVFTLGHPTLPKGVN